MALQLNRKYANLPDLDSAPDVYETPELTDDNSTTLGHARSDSTVSNKENDFIENESSEISRSRLPLHEARLHFAPAIIDAQNVDFSDRLTAKRKSYKASSRRLKRKEIDTPQFEESSDEETESFGKKLARLKREIEDVKEFSRLQAGKNAINTDRTMELDPDVTALCKAMDEISSLQSTANQGYKGKLIKDLGSGIKINGPPQQPQSSEEPTTYTVTYAPVYQQSHALAKAANFDSRLSMLEKVLGVNTIEESSLIENGPRKAVLPSLEKIQKQVSVLSNSTPSSLDTMSRQIRKLTQEAEKLGNAQKVANIAQKALNTGEEISPKIEEDSELLMKVNALYGALPVIEKLRPILPSLLDRLHSLRAIHAAAATTKSALDQIDREQVKIADDIRNWQEGLSKMEKTMSEAEATMNSNVNFMREWVKALENNLATL
ncbi:Dynactin subunit 2 [Erysiphe neolycopersici]|uniref:Dynactin subunit 2 n=1 Tax=Erysiphe neolycopersici TaxID=212602 RepID=A0A420I0B9_9PEZI|nr:Dynactin subunit 2 [Erysiphe neolycopersici]